MENLPISISFFFGIITLVTLFLFCWAVRNSDSEITRSRTGMILLILMCWLIIQAALALNGVYNKDLHLLPPKIVIFGISPPVFTIILLFNLKKGQLFIDSLPILFITYINTIRIFVEIILYWLFLYKVIPELMTFRGVNFDILAGITALFIAYYGINTLKISTHWILWWNIISLILLVNIVVIAFLSASSPLQKIAFEQPNIAILYFPFSWLPAFIVPIVLLGHLVSIRQLLKQR